MREGVGGFRLTHWLMGTQNSETSPPTLNLKSEIANLKSFAFHLLPVSALHPPVLSALQGAREPSVIVTRLEHKSLDSSLTTHDSSLVFHTGQLNIGLGNHTGGKGKRVWWRWPGLPPRCRGSTLGAGRLNDRVRDGTGCIPAALITTRPWFGLSAIHLLMADRKDHGWSG